MAINWSGDILQAKNRADEAKNGVHLGYSVPKESALAFFDMMAIPKEAKNLDGVYAWLNYIMDLKVIADVSNRMNYANGNKASLSLISMPTSAITRASSRRLKRCRNCSC